MAILIMGVIVLALCAGLLAIVSVVKGAGGLTCAVCGGRLPVITSVDSPESRLAGDWTCPKCGTRFNPYGRARDGRAI